jgi:endoglucanase
LLKVLTTVSIVKVANLSATEGGIVMKKWTTVLAIAVAGAMIAGTALAQSTPATPDQQKQNRDQKQSAPDIEKKDKAQTPGATGTTSGGASASGGASTSGSKDTSKSSAGTSGSASGGASGGASTSPSASPSTSGGSASGAAGASGTMKSDKSSDSMKSGSAMKGGNREQVKAAQEALKEKGVDPGPVDGVMGPKTQQALREFQKKEGLKESGNLDTETMAKLGVQKTSGTDSSSPSASPSTGASSGASGSAGASGSGAGAASKSPSASPSTGGSAAPGGPTGAKDQQQQKK